MIVGTRSVSRVVSAAAFAADVKNGLIHWFADGGIVTFTVTCPVESVMTAGVTVTVAPAIPMIASILSAAAFASPAVAPGTITFRAAS